MKPSHNKQVQTFLKEVEMMDCEKYEILQKLRDLVFTQYPQTTERMMYGGITFSLENNFGGLFVYKHHVSFEFSNGFMMSDPDTLLEGSGKFRRHLKIKTLSDIDDKKIDFFVQQIKNPKKF
jgi:hypothetical protein